MRTLAGTPTDSESSHRIPRQRVRGRSGVCANCIRNADQDQPTGKARTQNLSFYQLQTLPRNPLSSRNDRQTSLACGTSSRRIPSPVSRARAQRVGSCSNRDTRPEPADGCLKAPSLKAGDRARAGHSDAIRSVATLCPPSISQVSGGSRAPYHIQQPDHVYVGT